MPNNIVRRYQVERLSGTKKVTKAKYVFDDPDHKTSHIEYEEVEEPLGFMVYFPAGHSIRIATETELRRLGFNRIPGLVDQDTGEIIEQDRDEELVEDEDNSPKALVRKSTRARPHHVEVEAEA